MNFFEVLFGNLLTVTVAGAAIVIMIALAVTAVRNILNQQNTNKKDKDL